MAETLTYQAIRTANQAREADEQRTETRKKNLLILMLQYLSVEGYRESAQSLSRETNIDLNRFEVCDNVDLETVLMEYESFYYIKFARYPKITKKLSQSADDRGRMSSNKPGNKNKSTPPGYQRAATFHSRHQILPAVLHDEGKQLALWEREPLPKIQETNSSTGSTPTLPRLPPPQNKPPTPQGKRPASGKKLTGTTANPKQQAICNGTSNNHAEASNGLESLALQGMTVHGAQSTPEVSVGKQRKAGQIVDIRSMITNATRLNVEEGSNNMDPSERLLKPLGGYVGFNMEWRELAQIISRDIYSENPDVRWDDIIGLDHAKRLVKEAVVYPIRYPELFTGILSPWKGLLLYGPPGTGKTLLAKAVATECKTTFFNISASSIVSKWRGESEKLVRVLFEMARFHAPSTIFLDELESVMSQRGSQGGGGEHEGSRRMKTELLVQMDGLAKTDDLVFLLAASNLPWELDHAMLRRLEKRIIVDLPTTEARAAMFKHHLPPVVCGGHGNALQLEADLDYDLLSRKTEGYSGSDIRLVCKEAAMRPVRKIFELLENHSNEAPLNIQLDTLTTNDVQTALMHTKPSARNLVGKYQAWQQEYESV